MCTRAFEVEISAVHVHVLYLTTPPPSPACIDPATRCDAVHSRWDVLKLRYIKIACDVPRCIFQHVGNFAPDFGISQPLIIRFSNGLQHCDGFNISFHVICG